ncbi:hypothetical protein FXO38_05055 [Capsicum annuum]|nr:hypothetical protein FXO38_05055 [Capsicum annuum]
MIQDKLIMVQTIDGNILPSKQGLQSINIKGYNASLLQMQEAILLHRSPPEEQGEYMESQATSSDSAANHNLDGASLDSPSRYSSSPSNPLRCMPIDSLITWDRFIPATKVRRSFGVTEAVVPSSPSSNPSLTTDQSPIPAKSTISSNQQGRVEVPTWSSSLLRFNPARGPKTTIHWPIRMRIVIGITKGIFFRHTKENIIHGNLTSSNILLDEQNNPKIEDVGLSRLMTTAGNTNMIATAGTLGYSAPELSKIKNSSTKTDVYSLGVIILEILTGKSPSEATDGLDLPQWVASIVK